VLYLTLLQAGGLEMLTLGLLAQCLINLLKPSGNFTYHQLNVQKFHMLLALRLCVLYGSQNKQQLLPYKTLRDWFL
jgi:hypothetical protein